MNIQRIDLTKKMLSFQGLFTDKSRFNDGNWKMEYRPYSWEKCARMALKQKFDLADTVLPDNEEIYTCFGNGKNYVKEVSKDILGTVSYYKYIDAENGTDVMRSTITNMPCMNLMESLDVKYRKLSAFLDMKHDKMSFLELEFEQAPEKVGAQKKRFDSATDEMRGLGFLSSRKDRNSVLAKIEYIYSRTQDSLKDIISNITYYVKLRDSAEVVKHERKMVRAELEKIRKAKDEGNLIDISRRDVKDPNKALWDAMHNVEEASEKLVALCHRTISVKEILDGIGKNVSKDQIPAKAINFVENLMAKRI